MFRGSIRVSLRSILRHPASRTRTRFLSASQIMQTAKGKYDDVKPIFWIDCEMTGLDHLNDHIIEICCLVTDKDLNVIDEDGYESVIHYPADVMDHMNEWCINQHGKSGLTKRVLDSDKTLATVQRELLDYLKRFASPRVGILAGNSVHMDRLFMLREMPDVVHYMTYRIIDVSSVMEIAKRHNPKVNELQPKKETAHTAKKDILESINQLRYYEDVYLKSPQEVDTDAVQKKWASQEDE